MSKSDCLSERNSIDSDSFVDPDLARLRSPTMSKLSPEKEVKAPNLVERAKEEVEAILHSEKSPSAGRHGETHGTREDIDETTALEDVRAPNVLERAKEEVEALIQTIHAKKETPMNQTRDEDHKEVTPKFIEKAKETIEKIMHQEKKPHHRSETHGRSDDIDEDTPVDEVKAPNVFERAKEELEAIFQTIHPPKVDN